MGSPIEGPRHSRLWAFLISACSMVALDTVPFALWQAHQALAKGMSFAHVMESIVEVGGDTDTVAAMVGGIIGNKIFPSAEEIERTEPLPDDIKP